MVTTMEEWRDALLYSLFSVVAMGVPKVTYRSVTSRDKHADDSNMSSSVRQIFGDENKCPI